jgi:hypothetical protein
MYMANEPKPNDLVVHRTAEFVSRYANNVRFESYASDLKIIFGQSDQPSGKEIIEQHTAITLSWAQVKLGIYYLRAQLLMYEAQAGAVSIHPLLVPAAWPDEPPEAAGKDDPRAKETLERLRQLREQLISGTSD